MPKESAGSIQFWPVTRIAQPPPMTAAVDSVSPSMWRKALRMFRSLLLRHSMMEMTPLTTTPVAATPIISPGCTGTGATSRWPAS